MTISELDGFLEKHQNIEHVLLEDEGKILFRNTDVAWYQNDENRATAVNFEKLNEMDTDSLMREINRGLMVDGITRITGYFTRTSSWNPGKRGELKDRNRAAV